MTHKGTDLKLLLSSISECLKVYTVNELNEAITHYLNENNPKRSEISFVLSSVCEMYSISQRMLINSANRGKIKEARKLAACIIYYELKQTYRHIASHIFCTRSHTGIQRQIQQFAERNEKIKSDREFTEMYQEMQKRLLTFIISTSGKSSPDNAEGSQNIQENDTQRTA